MHAVMLVWFRALSCEAGGTKKDMKQVCIPSIATVTDARIIMAGDAVFGLSTCGGIPSPCSSSPVARTLSAHPGWQVCSMTMGDPSGPMPSWIDCQMVSFVMVHRACILTLGSQGLVSSWRVARKWIQITQRATP